MVDFNDALAAFDEDTEKAKQKHGFESALEGFDQAVAGQPRETDEPGDFIPNLKAGVEETIGLTRAAVGTGQELLGFENAATESFEAAGKRFDEAHRLTAGLVDNIDKIEDVGSFVDFMQGVAGRQLPIIASIVATGGVVEL